LVELECMYTCTLVVNEREPARIGRHSRSGHSSDRKGLRGGGKRRVYVYISS